ncbi:MAG: L-lactate permease [Coprococcus sp.]
MVVEFILALLPIIWLFIAFLVLKVPGYIGCLIALVISIIESLLIPSFILTVPQAITAAVEGAITAIWPICLIILAAMFTYNVCVKTGAMEMIKRLLTSVTNDKRVLVMILTWGFGGFMEAIAGFGTPVAIPAAMMVGLGFDPIFSAVVCLVANSIAPPFGSVAIPTTSAANAVGLDPALLSGPAINMLIVPAIIVPFIIIWMTGKACGGRRPFEGMIPFTIIAAISYVIPAALVGNFVGAEFVDLIGCVICLIVLVIYAKKMKPTMDPAYMIEADTNQEAAAEFGMGAAVLPYVLMLVFLLGTSKLVPPVNSFLAQFTTKFSVYAGEGAATISLSWIGNAGTLIFIAGIIGAFAQHMSVGEMVSTLGQTLKNMWKAMVTVIAIISLAKVMGYSGMTTAIARQLADLTGSVFPLFAPICGILGTFVTGSTTSSGVLFAKMQYEVAELINANPVMLVAANLAGGGIGKLISPQSIAIGVAAIGAGGSDGKIMSKTIGICIGLGIVVCIMSYLLAVVL